VAALRHIAHPIDLARAVMEQGRHVMLAGEGAERFAVERGFALEADGCFVTERRRQELAHVKAAAARANEAAGTAETPAGQGKPRADTADARTHIPWHPLGTVGAVALDAHGDLAAATSTGGLTNKLAGRVGDSPIIGAGTFAENGVCAVSGTGAGEYFLRFTAASEVAARVRFQGRSIEAAAREVLDMIAAAGGEGGLIVVDAHGNIAMPFSSQTMLRACAGSERVAEVTVESGP
jgi:beta-aspartyl-peptidase (threonine type)